MLVTLVKNKKMTFQIRKKKKLLYFYNGETKTGASISQMFFFSWCEFKPNINVYIDPAYGISDDQTNLIT